MRNTLIPTVYLVGSSDRATVTDGHEFISGETKRPMCLWKDSLFGMEDTHIMSMCYSLACWVSAVPSREEDEDSCAWS